MSKKRSPEDVVVEYFSTAPIERIDLLLNVVKGIVKRRTPPTPRMVARKKRTNTGTNTQSFIGEPAEAPRSLA